METLSIFFLPDKELLKQIKSIKTDSTPMEEPKNPDTDNVYAIYSLLATPEQKQALREKYLGGNFGYGHAKQALFDLIVEKFKKEREAFTYLMENPAEIDKKLEQGEAKARIIALEVLKKVREKLGFR